MGDGARKPPRLSLLTDSSIKITKIQTNITSPQTCFVTVILPPFLSLSLSLCFLCLSFSPSLSLFLFISLLPSSFLLQQREKRWSISSAGGEKNSSSVSRKSWWGEMEKARGSEGRFLRAERSRGREMERKGNTLEQHNRVSILLGIKSGSSSALTTLLLDKMFLLQRLACKLAARLRFLYPFCLLSACYIGWIIIRLLSPPCGWNLAYTSRQTKPEVANERQKRRHLVYSAWKYCYNVHVWV